MERDALLLTLRLSAATTAVLLFIAIPLAWWIVSGRGVVRAVVQAAVALPLVLPPTVLGFYLLVGMGPATAPGRLLIALIGHPLSFSFAGLLIGSCIYSLPFAVQPLVAGMRGLDPRLLEAVSGLGVRRQKLFFDVVLPVSRPALLVSALLTFAHTVGEFGVVLMLGGNIPGLTRTLSISIYDLVEDGRYAAANRASLFLLVVSAAVLLVIYLKPSRRFAASGGGIVD
ncbi:MAG: molybdate ABC transporter permease subunit [Rhodospirillales bacterium]|nr:molybdate ABC transporter permease subunit [Acetobacter sp.]